MHLHLEGGKERTLNGGGLAWAGALDTYSVVSGAIWDGKKIGRRESADAKIVVLYPHATLP